MSEGTEDAARRRRVAQLRERINDLIGEEVERTATDLFSLAYALLAEKYHTELSSDDRKRIKENYRPATAELIRERSMSEEGVAYMVALAIESARIAIDYLPQSNVKAERAIDDERRSAVAPKLARYLDSVFMFATDEGMSAFGAATTMILSGALLGAKAGVHWAALSRPLFDAFKIAFAGGKPTREEAKEQMIQALMMQLGVSRAMVLKYIADYERHHPNET